MIFSRYLFRVLRNNVIFVAFRNIDVFLRVNAITAESSKGDRSFGGGGKMRCLLRGVISAGIRMRFCKLAHFSNIEISKKFVKIQFCNRILPALLVQSFAEISGGVNNVLFVTMKEMSVHF